MHNKNKNGYKNILTNETDVFMHDINNFGVP